MASTTSKKSLSFVLPDLHVKKAILDKVHNEVSRDDILATGRAVDGVNDSMLKSMELARRIVLGCSRFYSVNFPKRKKLKDE